MRNWKNWLFPILTALTTAALALLPLRLSVMQDQQLTGTVHAEPISEDSSFPAKPPDLPERIWLLVQWRELPDRLTVMAQELEGSERDREFQRLRDALTGLKDILPPDLVEQLTGIHGDSWDCNRYYLRDQTDLSSAAFSEIGTYDKSAGIALLAILSAESGQLVELQVSGTSDIPFERSPMETGRALLDRMGLTYEAADARVSEALYGMECFHLPECRSLFLVNQYDSGLYFGFQPDWELVDAELAEAFGYPTDADSMQIR